MRKGINARAWFYGQSFHGNIQTSTARIIGLNEETDSVCVAVTDSGGLQHRVNIPRPSDGKFPSSEELIIAAKAIAEGRR